MQRAMTLLPQPTSLIPPWALALWQNVAAASKRLLYSDLCQSYTFISLAVESAGSIGRDALEFLHDLGRRTRSKTKDPLSYLKMSEDQCVHPEI